MKNKRLVITKFIEGEYNFLSGLIDDNFENYFIAYENGTCKGQLGFDYYSLSSNNNINNLLKKIISKLEYNFSKPGQLNILAFKILFKKVFWQSKIIQFHLVYSFMPLALIRLICLIKECEWVIHDQSLITGHCITPVGCDNNKNGCGQCPDLLRTHAIKHDKTKRNLRYNLKFISKFNGKFIFTNENFRNIFLHHLTEKQLITEVRKIKVKVFSKSSISNSKGLKNIGINISDRFEKNDLLVALILKNLNLEPNVLFHAFGGEPNFWIKKETQNIKLYKFIYPWDVQKIMGLTDYFLILSTAESLGLMFVETINSSSIPILLSQSPIINNYNLIHYLQINNSKDLQEILLNDSHFTRIETLNKYKKEIALFYGR